MAPQIAGPPPVVGVPFGAGPVRGVAVQRPFQLDAHQQRVCDFRSGLGVVPAAAGAGKSTTLVERTIDLVAEGTVPEAVCVLVYNRDAADGLRAKLGARIGRHAADRVQVFTFHAWCYALLRAWFPQDPRFAPRRILGTPGAPHPAKVASILIEEEKLDVSWRRAVEVAARLAEDLLDPVDPEALTAAAVYLGADLREDGKVDAADMKRALPYVDFAKAWREYKRREALMEFSDMLHEVGIAVRTQPEAAHVRHLRRLYAHVMVDEAQDINVARYEVARWIGDPPWRPEVPGEAQSVVFVGDARQAIYGWQGAQPELFLGLARESHAVVLPLPVNRRSTARIVSAANELAEGRSWNFGGACAPSATALAGEPMLVTAQASPGEETADIIADIQQRRASGLPLTVGGSPTFCVLARTNAMLVDLECAFISRGVPVRIAGAPEGVWGSTLGSQLLAYLEAASGLTTWGLMDVANTPKRFVKRQDLAEFIRATIERCKTTPVRLDVALYERYLEGESAHRSGRRADRRLAFQRLSSDLRDVNALPWPEQVRRVGRWLGADEEDEAELAGGDQDRRGALLALMDLAINLGSLEQVYAYKAAAASASNQQAVLLSTIHKQKGAEFSIVYVSGVRAQKLPHDRAEDEEEELRLLYVAITRGRDVVRVSTGGKPSKFLLDLGWVSEIEDEDDRVVSTFGGYS